VVGEQLASTIVGVTRLQMILSCHHYQQLKWQYIVNCHLL